MNYAEIDDIIKLFRKLTQEEREKAEALIPIVCDSLRYEAEKVGKDLDALVVNDENLSSVAKSVVVDVVARALNTSTTSEPMSQMSQSGMGYTISGTYLVPGGGLFIKKSELGRLGLKRQRYGVVELWNSEE